MLIRSIPVALAAVLASLLAGGCGGSARTSTSGASGALSPDARSAATGDIPDNQNFLTYRNRTLGFSIVYPEGWALAPAQDGVTFRDKNNLVRIAITRGSKPTEAVVRAQVLALRRSDPSLQPGTPQPAGLTSGPAVKVTYTTRSSPNPVTGKRVTLMVDRYELAHGGRVATLDLGTPTGVDNVDAYKMMANSFRWL